MTSYTWNGVSGHWRTASDWSPAGGPPTASDAATIDGSGTYTVTVRLRDFASSLTLSDPNATLNDEGAHASLTIGGALTISDGTLNLSSTDDDGGSLTVGSLNLSGGSLNLDGELNLNGTLSQTGGTLTLDGTVSGGTIDSTAGTLNFQYATLSGVTFDGPLNLTSTSEQQSVYFANGTTVVGSSGSGPGVINATGSFTQLFFDNTETVSNETINLGGNSSTDYLSENDTAEAGHQVLTLEASATINVQGPASIGAGGDFSGDGIANEGVIDQTGTGGQLQFSMNTFTNSGTIDARTTGGSLLIFKSNFTNTGTIDATNTGTIDAANGEKVAIEANVAGTGTDTISGGSTLEFGAGVSTAATLGDQDVDFTGAGALHLLNPASFYGEISDFAAGDTVELKGAWDFSAISQAGGMTTLTLMSGSTTHGFEFVGNYAESHFSITPGTTTTIGFE
jgi:hypothetical protein